MLFDSILVRSATRYLLCFYDLDWKVGENAVALLVNSGISVCAYI